MYGVHRHDPTFPPYFKYTAHGEKCIHKKMWDGNAVRRHDLTFSHTLNTRPMEEDLYIKKYTGWVCNMHGVHRHDPTFPTYFEYKIYRSL